MLLLKPYVRAGIDVGKLLKFEHPPAVAGNGLLGEMLRMAFTIQQVYM